MNWWILKIAKSFIKQNILIAIAVFVGSGALAWDVDLSRRIKSVENTTTEELRWPSSLRPVEDLFNDSPVERVFSSVEPAQSIAILNTENGFVPDTIRVRKDGNYKIFIVNVNEKAKNNSFLLDSFGQSYGTYFGKLKSFDLVPKINGIFTFICPETGAQGKFIVYSDKESPPPVAVSKNEAKK